MEKLELNEEELKNVSGGDATSMKTRLICLTSGCGYNNWSLGENMVGAYFQCPRCNNNSLYRAWAQPID